MEHPLLSIWYYGLKAGVYLVILDPWEGKEEGRGDNTSDAKSSICPDTGHGLEMIAQAECQIALYLDIYHIEAPKACLGLPCIIMAA